MIRYKTINLVYNLGQLFIFKHSIYLLMAVHLVRTVVQRRPSTVTRSALHPAHTRLYLRARVTVFGRHGDLQQPVQPLVVVVRRHIVRCRSRLLLAAAHPLRQHARVEGASVRAATDGRWPAANGQMRPVELLLLLQQMAPAMAHAQQLAGVPAGHDGAAPAERSQHVRLVIVTVAALAEVIVRR